MTNLQEHKVFWGPITELIERARLASKAINISPVKLTDRLIRYYSAQGVLDKPDRLGRDAAYNFRHLLQLLTARRLSSKGISLEIIGRHNLSTTTDQLHEDLFKPVAVDDFIPKEKTEDGISAVLNKQVVGTPVAMVDLLAEVRGLSETIKKEREEFYGLRNELSWLVTNVKDLEQKLSCVSSEFQIFAHSMRASEDQIRRTAGNFEHTLYENVKNFSSRFDHMCESIERLEKSFAISATNITSAK
jgi:DNA-binding transcriptional MerR regulator